MTVTKRILSSCASGVVLTILDFFIVLIIPYKEFSNGKFTPFPWWVEVITFPLRYGVRLNKRFLSPTTDDSFILFRWSDVVACFLGAFLLFGVLTYILLLWLSRRQRGS